MSIAWGPTQFVSTINYVSPNFSSGTAATVLGWNGPTESSTTCTQLAFSLAGRIDDHLLDELDSDVTVESVRAESANFSVEVGVNLPGARAGGAAPPNLAVLVTHSALGKGPRHRGRNYFPGIVAADQVTEEGVINPLRVDSMQTAWDNIVTEMWSGSPSFTLAITQSDTPTQESSPVIPWPTVIQSVVQSRAATQRRRLRR